MSARNDASDVFARLDRSGGPDACWPWTGRRTRKGYGVMDIWGGTYFAHRVVASLSGDVEGWVVRHSCDNPPCCNPSHLLIGTHADNVRDMVERGGRKGKGRGEDQHLAKLNEDAVRAIRVQLAAGRPQRAIAATFGVSQGSIWAVGARHTWGWVT